MSSWKIALDTVVRERGAALFGYAYVLTGDADAAEDLLQDALVRAFRRTRSNQSIDATHIYVKRAITTAFIDGGRRKASRPQRALGETGDIYSPVSPAARATQTDHAQDVAQALDLHAAILTLPPRERACVVLHYLEDLPVATVAAQLGLATGTVKRYLSDAVATLRTRCTDVDFPLPEDTPNRPHNHVNVRVVTTPQGGQS